MTIRNYPDNLWSMTGGLTPMGFKYEFSIVEDRGDLDAPPCVPGGSFVGHQDGLVTVTCPSLGYRS